MQIRCDGCGRVFTPSGLSQHLSKTQNLRCRRSLAQTGFASVSPPDRAPDSQDLSGSPVRPQYGKFAVSC